MSTLEPDSAPTCSQCSRPTVAAFVQNGSYFTKCTACGYEGPATSWLTLSLQLEGDLKALEVSETYEELALIAEGSIREIVTPISQAASRGALIRLVHATSGA